MNKLSFFAVLLASALYANTSRAESVWYNPSTWFNDNEATLSGDAILDSKAALLSVSSRVLDEKVLKLGLEAYQKAKEQGLINKPILTIIDYSKPSSEPRLVVLNLENNTSPFQLHVAHGKNSGDIIPTRFSNHHQSLASSFGVFLTGQTYSGKHGVSLRLNGLEPGVNDNALARGVVIHGANYVNAIVAKRFGRVGRSWGCPAVDAAVVKPFINMIKGGTLVFAYYPDKRWLASSRFLS